MERMREIGLLLALLCLRFQTGTNPTPNPKQNCNRKHPNTTRQNGGTRMVYRIWPITSPIKFRYP